MLSSAAAIAWCCAVSLPDAALAAPAAAAARIRIDIPAGPLPASLAAWSAATGLSVGIPGALPRVRSHAVHGALTPAEALRRLLEGTGYHAVAISPRSFRLDKDAPRAAPPRPRHSERRAPHSTMPAPDIIVTATKRPERLAALPTAAAVALPDRLGSGIVSPDSETIASDVNGLAFTNLGPGRNRAFIRGVADSPFNGPSQSTVAVVLDDSRITYDAPDPDLLLVDVDRVEVLKGPQGPLYGSGALGGIFRIVTNAPDAAASSGAAVAIAQAAAHGGLGGGGDLTVNLPLVDQQLAVRAVGYYRAQPGWIDDIGGARDTNRTTIAGGRIAMRWTPNADWQVDLGGTLQALNAADSQYVMAANGSLSRVHPIPEPADNDFAQVHFEVHGKLGGLRLTSTSSYIAQAIDYRLDASAAAADFGVAAPAVFADDRRYTIVNQEVRIAPAAAGRLNWVAGLAYLHASSSIDGTIAAGAAKLPVESIDQDVSEYAAFGEASAPIGPFTITAGARLFATDAANERAEHLSRRERSRRKLGFSPSLSLSWRPAEGRYFFLRYARALRPGGLAAGSGAREGEYDSDELGSLDGGLRWSFAGGAAAFEAGAFYTDWHDVQSDYLLPNGLISTRNAGNAQIIGADASLDWAIGGGWSVSAGVNAEQAELVSTADGARLDDRRLPVSPNLTVRGRLSYSFDLGGWTTHLVADGNYIGSARLSFDPDLDRHMGDYAVFALAATARRGAWSVTGRLDNLLDITGDSFSFGNPFSIREGPQYTPLRPRTLSLSIGFDW